MNEDEYMESQKTVYTLQRKRPLEAENDLTSHGEGRTLASKDVPFLQLLGGSEPLENTRLRYRLFEESRFHQGQKIESILTKLSASSSKEIETLIKGPIGQRTQACLLHSNSSLTTSLVFLEQLTTYLQSKESYKVVTLDSKEATTMKLALKAIVKGVTGNDDNDFDNEDEEDEEIKTFDKRHPWDLDIAQEWCEIQWQRTSKTLETSGLRIVLILEDTESFSVGLLNRLLKLLCAYNDRIPLKLIFNVGTNVKNFDAKLSNEVSLQLDYRKFNVEHTNEIINQLVSDIVLSHDLLLDEDLAKFILSRFNFTEKNFNELMKTMTYSKMIHYFANPLSILPRMDEDQIKNLPAQYFDALRKLPSFKSHTETLEELALTDELELLLSDNTTVIKAFLTAAHNYSKYSARFKAIYKFVIELIVPLTFRDGVNFMEVYCKLINTDGFVSTQFVNEMMRLLKSINADELARLVSKIEIIAQGSDFMHTLYSKLKTRVRLEILQKFEGENEAESLTYKIEQRKLVENLVTVLDEFLKNNINSYKQILFHEVFFCRDADVVKNILVPKNKEVILESLINPEKYLQSSSTGHPVLDKMNNAIAPLITHVYSIYKETTLDLNIYDYYTAFKNSLAQEEIMQDINLILDDPQKILEGHLNDDLRFKFIFHFFNDTEMSEQEKWDRLTLTFFIQKCEELTFCGFFKTRPVGGKRAAFLEKAIWKSI